MDQKSTSATALPLQDIQANILKSHGRNFVRLILFEFKPDCAPKLRQLISNLAYEEVTSAEEQLKNTIDFKLCKEPPRHYVLTLSLSYQGYLYLGVDPKDIPQDLAFENGMQSPRTQKVLQDRDFNRWDHKYRFRSYHMMVCIAADDESLLANVQRFLIQEFSDFLIQPVHWERGMKLFKEFPTRPGERVAVEVFGFADGISQPDLSSDENKLKYALVEESAKDRYGSFLVYRKIRQHKQFYEQLVDQLLLASKVPSSQQDDEFRQFIEAQIMGRFHDGTPLTSFSEPRMFEEWDDNFDYAGDLGHRCPFHAHVRKTNPRLGQDDPRIVRRAIPYKEKRENDEGLLFICFQRSIVDQFERVHQHWANNPLFGSQQLVSGKDPLMTYQINRSPYPQRWNLDWGTRDGRTFYKNLKDIIKDTQHIVTLEGGEYFYASSISFLKELVFLA